MPYSQYVNIKQGTRSSSRYSNGNTLPLVQLPFGMNGFTLQTNSNRNHWMYHPDDRSLEGIRLTHQPSPWIGDYTPLVILPQRETFTMDPNTRWSGFRPEDTRLQPHGLHVESAQIQNDAGTCANAERRNYQADVFGRGTGRFIHICQRRIRVCDRR